MATHGSAQTIPTGFCRQPDRLICDYIEVERPAVLVPERMRHADYSRNRVPAEIMVPEFY